METAVKTTWKVDTAHSKLGFNVAHLMITETTGYFKVYEGQVITEGEGFEGAEINFSIDATSLNTENEMRDNHLRTDEFFGVEKFPKLNFVGTSLTKVEGNKYLLKGNLTIKETTKEVSLNVKFNGTATDPYGTTKAGFKFSGEINRVDFGVGTPGGLVVGETVELNGFIELDKVQA